MQKTVLIIATALGLILTLPSCVKTYKCECVTTKNGEVKDTDMTEFPGTKKLTKQMCQDHEDDLNEIKFDDEEVITCTQK